jgi:putative ABC transport system ATP-binding protein
VPHAISVQNVTRHYRLGESLVPAVDGISLDVEQGEFAALLGASGSGKSTLMNLIAGLDRPTSGAIVVLNKDLAKMSSEELARYRRLTVGMVFQSFNLVPTMRVDENVELPLRFAEVPREEREARVRAALDRVGLTKRRQHRPSEISGGEQQRTAIARALVNQPTILLADEPTGNLDSRTGTEIMSLLQELNSTLGMTVLMVTHERALADKYAHRQFHLGDGKLLQVVSSRAEQPQAAEPRDLLFSRRPGSEVTR